LNKANTISTPEYYCFIQHSETSLFT